MNIVYAEKYYDKVRERFPELSEKQVDKIIKFGLRSFYFYNKRGADVLMKSNYYTAYAGKLFGHQETFYKYRAIKKQIKIRLKYCLKRTPWNGKYYFALTEEQYQEFLSQFHKRGRRKRKVKFPSLLVYKILDESKIGHRKYIYECTIPKEVGFCRRLTDCTIRNFKLIEVMNSDGTYTPVSDGGK